MTEGVAPLHDAAVPQGCGVTVLRALGARRATKLWRWNATLGEWSKVSYEAGALFEPREHQVRDLAELVQVLDDARRDPRAFVVRGALAPAVRERLAGDPDTRIRRRKHAKGGVEPSLVEVPRRWIMIDVDGWPLPGWADLVDDPEAAIDGAIHELLPEAFHDAECWWQLSASAGFSPGLLKCHLFFWLAEPADNPHIKRVLAQHAPGVDRAPFNAAQPHFVADPIIQGGHDPLPRRTGWRKGLEPAVHLPALVPQVLTPRSAGTGTGTVGRGGGIAHALARLGHAEGGEGFHAPLRAAVLAYARRVNRGGERDDDVLKAELRAAIRAAPCRPGGDVETPYCQEYYLQSSIDGAFAYLGGRTELLTMRPHHQAPSGSVAHARRVLAEHVDAFSRRALTWHLTEGPDGTKPPPEHAGLAVGVGIGKSTAGRRVLPDHIAAAKAAGVPHRVAWLVPTHKLGSETQAEMEKLGLNVAVWRGREAAVPGTGEPEDGIAGEPMCLNLDAVQDALRIGEDVERAVCGSGQEGKPACPFREQCAFQRQKAAVARADIVILAHQFLFGRLPREVGDGLGLVVVDEAWWQAGVDPNRVVHLANFAEAPVLHPVRTRVAPEGVSRAEQRERDEADTNDLHVLSKKAQDAFTATPDGEQVGKAAVIAAGLTAEDCALARKLEWRRKVEGVIVPGMAPDVRRAAVETAAGNAAVPRRAGIWAALEELLRGDASHTGRLQMGTRVGADGEGPVRVVLLHSRREIRDAIAGLPILYLDATMPTEVVRHFLPRLDVLAEVQAQAPHMRVHQITGGWGKTSLVPSDRAAPEENRRRRALVAELADFARLNSGGDGLVITYQDIEPAFAAPGIRTGHFNAIAGLDSFHDVRALFLIGRPLPDARHLRAAAMALTGRAIAPEDGRRETRGVLMADGTGAATEVRAFADPDLEALRVAISEAECIQGIGRARAVNRDASTPLDVFVLADVVLPLPVTRLVPWDHVRPGVLARMLARGVVLRNPTDAHKAYPDLFATPKAAEHAIARAKAAGEESPNPLGGVFLGGWGTPRPIEVIYHPAGQGQKARRASVAPSMLSGFPAWLAGVVGPLAHYAEHVADAEHGCGSLPVPDAPPAPVEGLPARAYLPGDVARSPPPVERVLAPTRPAPVRTAVAWPVVPLAPVLDEASGHALAPPLRGGAVPAYGATWHGSGAD